MNQPSSRETTATAAPTPPLPTVLQAVLASLDVDIDAELARYRRHRRGEKLEPSFRTIAGEKVQKNLDLIQLSPTSSSKANSELPNSGVAVSGTPLPPSGEESAAPPTTSLPFEPYTSAPIVPVSGNGAASPEASPHTPRVEPEVVTTEPDDYLESSEALLKSIDEENSRDISPELATTSRPKSKNFLTPLTVGAALLFVAASGTLAYALLNGGGNWRLQRLWQGESPAPTTAVTGQTPNPVTTAEPTSPNLARREFVPLDVETLGTLEGNESSLPTPTPAQAPTGVATAPQTQPTAASLPEVAVATTPQTPGTAPTLPNSGGLENINQILLPDSVKQTPKAPAQGGSPTAAATAPTAAAKAPTAAATAPAVPADLALPQFYYLLMEYKNDDSLRQARDWVPDAYVREFPIGVRIQLGAYDDEPTAKEVAAELKQYGLPVVLYQP